MALLIFHHYSHGSVTQPQVRQSSFQSPSRSSPPTSSAI